MKGQGTGSIHRQGTKSQREAEKEWLAQKCLPFPSPARFSLIFSPGRAINSILTEAQRVRFLRVSFPHFSFLPFPLSDSILT
ncbi:hypothetical protein DB346_05960 [Verrucomicrobia bacterium LW23]|nr:hypothetical protein DB346_05960 [Verrucomicrobia bacterium LW23]